MIRLDTLQPDHPLRNAPLCDIGAQYRWVYSKGRPRPVLRAFGIARNTFNQLGAVWTEQYEWYAEDAA
jgi:hypothetical protein